MNVKRIFKFVSVLMVCVLLIQTSGMSAIAASKATSNASNQGASTATASSYTGMKKVDGVWCYLVNGEVATSYSGLVKYNSKWVYVHKGKLNTTYTGLVKYKNSWVYVNKGKLDNTYTGMVKYKDSWVYVNKGKFDTTYTGLSKNKHGWWYMDGGKLDLTYHGFARNQYGLWYVTGGKLNTAVSGIVSDKGSKWYVVDGMIDTSYSGKVRIGKMTYIIEDGKVVSEIDSLRDVELTIWCPAEDRNFGWIQKVCNDFKELHPEWNITFNIETCLEDEVAKQMTNDPTKGADVYMFTNDTMTTLLNVNAIVKLDAETVNYIKETNSETMVATVTRDGNVYGIPYTGNTWFMYYDKSVYTEDDVKSLDKMLEKGVVSFPITNSWYFASFYAAGGGIFCGVNGDDEEAGVVLGDKATDVTKYLVDLVSNENFVKDDYYSTGIAGLKDKSVNAVFTGSWEYRNIKDILGDNMGIVQLPTINIQGKKCSLKSFAGSKAVGINPHCDYQEAAVEFAKYLAGEDAQRLHYEMRNVIPCNTTLLKSEAFKDNELVQAQNNTIANTSIIQPYNNTFNSNYWDNAVNFAWNIIDGDVTKDNADEKTKEFEDALNGR